MTQVIRENYFKPSTGMKIVGLIVFTIAIFHADCSSAGRLSLSKYFPDGIYIGGGRCTDNIDGLAKLSFVTKKVNFGFASIFEIKGHLKIDKLPQNYSLAKKNGGEKYIVYVKAWIIKNGKIVFSREGFPDGHAYFGINGGEADFILANGINKPVNGGKLIVVVAGEPIFNRVANVFTEAILGMEKFDLPTKLKEIKIESDLYRKI